jgi:hypothetical protein
MQKLSIPLRAVFYMQEDRWVAHCLEFDLCGDGDTQAEALESMTAAIICQVENAVENENAADLFNPADGKFFRMFASGKRVAMGDLEIHIPENDTIVIEDFEAREYVDDGLARAE